ESARPRQRDGLPATTNGVSTRRPNFHHQLPSTNAVPDVGKDKFSSVFLAPDTLKGGHQTAHGRHNENCS
ncbi:MAG: hypothetical protein NT154_08580, partial [Verrucomicrobia bacterium]|nr:hypothetical protein [Verrucomicrobiota bacterium]